MKEWLKFAILPYIIRSILEIIGGIVFGVFLNQGPESFANFISFLIVNFIVGVSVYNLAPAKKLPLSITYCTILTISSFYSQIIANGSYVVILGEKVYNEFRFAPEIAKFIGLFLGVFGSYQSEKDELETRSSTSVEK